MKSKIAYLFLFGYLFSLFPGRINAQGGAPDNWQYSLDPIVGATDGICNGAITLNVDPQTGPHSFEWSNGSESQNLDQLCPGIYTVTITEASGCQWTLTGEVSASGCFLSNNVLVEEIDPFCPGDPGGISIDVNYPITYNYAWSTGATSAEIKGLCPGEYCVTISDLIDTSCTLLKCYAVGTDPECSPGGGNLSAPVIINELNVTLSEQYSPPFIELLVVGTGNCRAVDLRGFILDDNNGDFSKILHGSGIAPGHLRFPKTDQWRSVPVGSIILIYNSAIGSIKDLEDDPFDENQDMVYILPVTAFESHYQKFTASKPVKYQKEAQTQPGAWSAIWLYDAADAIQLRYPDGTYCHGFSFGNQHLVHGGPDRLWFPGTNAKGKVYFFNTGNIKSIGSYDQGQAMRGDATPGLPNNLANAGFIAGLCRKKAAYSPVSHPFPARAYPNPFQDAFTLETELPEDRNLLIKVHDFLGREVYRKQRLIPKGFHQLTIELNKGGSHGMYYLRLSEGEEVRYEQKLVRAQ